MPSNPAGRRAVLNLHNQNGLITLLELSHPDIMTKRLALNAANVTHAGNTYFAANFEVDYPTDDRGIPTGRMRISNVTKEVWQLIGNLEEPPPSIRLLWVLEDDTETIQDEWDLLDLSRVTGSALAVEGEFSHERYANEPHPSVRMTGRKFYWMNYW